MSRCDCVNARLTDTRFRNCLRNDWIQQIKMGTPGNFGDDAAIGLVQLGLAKDDRGKNLGLAFTAPHHRCGGIVAARFDAEDCEALLHAGSGCAGFHRR